MQNLLNQRSRPIRIATALIGAVLISMPVAGQETPLVDPSSPTEKSEVPTKQSEVTTSLRFSFDRTPWRDVIDWLALESNLALHVRDLPTGSFTYSDPNSFTPQEALDRVNLFLLPEGFTLVQSGNLLSVIDLSDPRATRQLDALAKLTTVDQLDELNDHDVVKCIFPLGKLDAEQAVEELSALKLMTTPAVFSKTNQLLITDTAIKLKSVRTILNAFKPDALTNGTVVRNFALQNVSAEDILIVARPHLGLATGEMIGIDVSLSADLQGKNIFVTGVEDKIKLMEGLINALDKPAKDLSPTLGEAELRSHVVQGGNVETVYNVLQTLLAGKSVRLSMDQTAGTVVALASPEIQMEIAQTVTQLQAAEAEFEVIPLKTVDPYFAITLLEQMLDLGSDLDDPDGVDPKAPRIDADPGNMRLFVRARRHQIEQIKKIIAELDQGTVSSSSSSDKVRLFPLRGKQAEQMVKTAAKFWRDENPIFLYTSNDSTQLDATERVLNGKPKNPFAAPIRTSSPKVELLTNNPNSKAVPIHCQLTPRGLLLQSNDTAALDTFEAQLRTITGPTETIPSAPIVFYLKYTRPDDAIRMLAELLDGGEAAREGEAGSLVNSYVTGASGSYMGSLVTSKDGTTTMIAGSITVVADSRLNRLIAQGTASDIDRIEGYLKIVDKDDSITSIETYGTSHVIELTYSRASEVADVIREAYATRVASNSTGANGGGGTATSAAQREAAAKKAAAAAQKKGGKPQASSKTAKNLEPKMTVAVHEASNSLIVTAPEQLFREVEQLARLIDARSQKSVRIVKVPGSVAIESLRQILSGENSRSKSKTRAR